ncbi:MAG: hypothetical protein AAB953_01390, partial [Patescibacteria group bacterium]
MPGTTFDRIQELERQLAAVQGERDRLSNEHKELSDQVGRLNQSNADLAEKVETRDAEIRRLNRRIEELEPQIKAKDDKIAELRKQVEDMETRVKKLEAKDQVALAQDQITVDRIRTQAEIDNRTMLEEDAEARKRTAARKIQTWGGILAPVVTLLIMAVAGLINNEVPKLYLLIGVPFIAMIFAILTPY